MSDLRRNMIQWWFCDAREKSYDNDDIKVMVCRLVTIIENVILMPKHFTQVIIINSTMPL